MNNSAINTDTVITNIKLNLYELRDIKIEELNQTERKEFETELTELEHLAKSILEKIKDKN